MKPAFSVIFLTTLIGAGQGLFLALFTHQSYALFGLLPTQSDPFYGYGSALALSLLVGGLIASFFHLGRPERAWRSATQWRTSWLSREVIVLPLDERFPIDPLGVMVPADARSEAAERLRAHVRLHCQPPVNNAG